MRPSEILRATAAATSLARSLGLPVDEAITLHNSNKLTLRLLPADVLARVAPMLPGAPEMARVEIEIAGLLAASGSPVAAIDPRVEPRVHERDGFAVSLWTYYAPATSAGFPPADYAGALARLHAGMRDLQLPAPHFTTRVGQALTLAESRDRTPALAEVDRTLLVDTLRNTANAITARARAEQFLHGEPHPGNLLNTVSGPRFIDFETYCRGPVEFDLAHAPDEVSAHYPGLDEELLRDCRILMLAIITTWRWDRDDQFPDGRRMGVEWLGRIRAALDR